MGTTTFKAANGKEVEVDATLWQLANDLTAGKGDGRLGKDDADKLFEAINADADYSPLEKKTIKHIRKNFKWTDKGNAHFRTLIRQSAGKGWTAEEIAEAME